MLPTTERVAERPTPSAVDSVRMPQWHDTIATKSPNNADLTSPEETVNIPLEETA